MSTTAPRIPREKEDDYTKDMAERRREFLHEQTAANLAHVGRFSIDPSVLPGNVENFFGVAQAVDCGCVDPVHSLVDGGSDGFH